MENSEMFRELLNEYVRQGGTLIVFAQQHGYEYSVLPIPDGKPLSGYGWAEDQSCRYRSVYIDTYHQILSGQRNITPSVNVDGYFTQYPDNSTILLRRTSNGQPAMLMYQYGNGYVIVTTMYSDWAYGHSQASREEIALVRDLISWAKNPAELPEIKPGETVSVTLSITNNTDTDASKVKLLILAPDRNLITEQTVNTTVPAGGTVTIPVTYATQSTAPLGIWHVDYELLDSSGNIIQPQAETDSGRFVVSSPPENPYKSPDFSFSIQSDAEYYLYGSPATFTVIAWNNTDIDHTLEFRYYLPHLGPPGTRTFDVPANSSTYFEIVVPEVKYQGWLWGTFYDESGRPVGSARKGIWMAWPLDISLQTDKESYAKGESVTITDFIKNNISYQYSVDVKTTVTDPSGTVVFEDTKTVELPASGTTTVTNSFVLPATSVLGRYTVKITTLYNGRILFSRYTRFTLPPVSQIRITPNLPDSFTAGTNTVSFTLENTGLIDVNSGQLQITFKDPDGVVLYEGSHGFSLPVGQSTTIDVPITIPSLKFGKYTLVYSQSDETRQGIPATTTIENSATVIASLDKSSYKVRQTATLTVDITNTGLFDLEGATLSVSVPDTGYTDTRSISLLQGQATELTFAIAIPESLTAGSHDVNVNMTLPSGSTITRRISLTIPQSWLEVRYQGPDTLNAADTVNIEVTNTGGVDTGLIYKVSLFDSRTTVYQESINDTIQAGQS
ncbi:MAG: hypothetical protein GXO97_04010, partial [Nitrospirae bacterium]|nr:hypothetical protein [Nitrospirota bacterium]